MCETVKALLPVAKMSLNDSYSGRLFYLNGSQWRGDFST